MSHVGMTADNDRTLLISALYELKSRIWIERRRVQAHVMPAVKMRSAAEAAAGRKRVRRITDGGSWSLSASEKRGVGRRTRRRKRVGTGGESRYDEVEGNASTKAGCREPENGLKFPETVESSSISDSPGEIGALET